MPIEILVEVKNGCVVAVYCTDPNAKVNILDWDAGDVDEELLAKTDTLNEVG